MPKVSVPPARESSADATLLLAMANGLAERVTGFIKAGGGPHSSDELVNYGDDDGALLSELRRLRPTPALVMLGAAGPSPSLNELLKNLSGLAHVQVVVVADHPEVHASAQLQGFPLGLPTAELSPARLNEALRLAAEWLHVRTTLRQAQQLYEKAEARFQDMADLCADWLWETDLNLNLMFSSSRKRPSGTATRGSPLVGCFLPEERLRIEDDFAELAKQPRPFYDRDYWSADRFGGRICWSVSGLPLVDDVTGEVVGFRGVAKDISSQKASTDQIYFLVNHDPLTGVLNRQRCQEELVRTLRAAKREGRSGVLVVLDIDRFAYVNQTYGHQIGDKLLVHFAQVLKDSIRTGDLVARMDGDTMAVLLRDVRPEDVPPRLERLQSAFAARPLPTEQGAISLNVSGGAAIYPNDSMDADQLLARAHDALATAKQRGPHRIHAYDPATTLAGAAEGHLEWVELVNECLEHHETRLVLYYQPIIPLSGPAKSWGHEHYEVLMRLVDRHGELVAPGKFMPTAEEFGLIPRLDQLVMLRTLQILKDWHAQGRKVHLSINLSGKTFDDAEFLKSAKAALKEANLPEKSLVLEITETALLRDLPQVKTFMSELRALGAGFALDDCGVGYSSFNYIRQLELDFIKIDGSFIRNLHLNSEDQAFVKALADVAGQKQISTVAEMVEHAGARDALVHLGIDFGQGYFFAPPQAELPAAGWSDQFKA